MLNELGGLAGGLAHGIDMGMRWRGMQKSLDLQQQHQDRLAKNDERDAEVHDMRKEQFASEKEVRDRRNSALREIAAYHSQATGEGAAPAPAAAAPMQTPAPQAGLAANAPMEQASGVPGTLAAATQQQPQQPEIPPAKVLEKGMVTGMYTPKNLTDIANIWAKHGLQDEGIKYMNQAYEAEKRGGVRAAMAFMQNNPGSAAEALKQGGIELEGLPVKAKPDDPEDMNWKINIKGQGEQTIDARNWLKSTMDVDEFFKAEDRRKKEQNDVAMENRKQDFVERKGNAELGLEAQKTRAQVDYLKSRGTLAEANADKADRDTGGLRPSRSSESQISSAIKRRETSFDRVSSVKDIDGKHEVDPIKRQELDSVANQYLTFLEDKRGEELDAREHHKFTDVMVSYPIGGTAEQVEQWQEKQLFPRFGIRRQGKEASGSLAGSGGAERGNIDLANRPVVKNSDGSISTVKSMSFNEDGKEVLIPTIREDGKVMSEDEAIAHYRKSGKHLGKFSTPDEATAFAKQLSANQGQRHGAGSGPKLGSLAALKEKERALAPIKKEMEGVQKALQTPGLDVNQKKALALKAQELAARRDSLK